MSMLMMELKRNKLIENFDCKLIIKEKRFLNHKHNTQNEKHFYGTSIKKK